MLHDEPKLLALLYARSHPPTKSGAVRLHQRSHQGNKQALLVFLLERFVVTPGDHLNTACRYQNMEAARFLIKHGEEGLFGDCGDAFEVGGEL